MQLLDLSTKESWSEGAIAVLQRYPQWQAQVEKALKSGGFSPYFAPVVVEVFDQSGLLLGMVLSEAMYEGEVPPESKSEFVAWCFDGELGVFYVGSEVIVNRLKPALFVLQEVK